MEDFEGKTIREASLSTPVRIVGFTDIPTVGGEFITVASKKEAEAMITAAANAAPVNQSINRRPNLPVVPIMIKADVLGTIEAIQHELEKFSSDRIIVKTVGATVGDITTLDVQNVGATANAIIVGFNVKVERAAEDVAERLGVEIKTFDIIYELAEWLEGALKERTPTQKDEVVTGSVKILKHFSVQKNIHVMGGRIDEGVIKLGQKVQILRRDIEIGKGTIKNLQQAKSDVKEVSEGEFGLQLDTRAEITAGDYLKPFDLVVS